MPACHIGDSARGRFARLLMLAFEGKHATLPVRVFASSDATGYPRN